MNDRETTPDDSASEAMPRDAGPFPWASFGALFALFLGLYGLTANRGPQWQDSGFHMLRIVTGELVNPLGLALSHPLHYFLGQAAMAVIPGEPSLAITLVSSLFGAITIAGVFGCTWQLTRSWSAAFIAAVSLGLAHTFWRMATQTESYTIVTALLVAECWSLVAWLATRRRATLWCAAVLNGLGVANHLLAILTTPIILAVAGKAMWRRQLSGRFFLSGVGAWLAAASPYWLLVATEAWRSPDSGVVLHSALFGHDFSGAVLNALPNARMLGISAGFTVLSFPNFLLPLAAIGMVLGGGLIGSPRRGVLLAGLAIHAAFALRYAVPDQHLFLLPTYLYLALIGGVGWTWLAGRVAPSARQWLLGSVAISLAWTPILYWPAPELARRLDVLGDDIRSQPYRDDYRYLFWPWSVAEVSAERIAREAVNLAGESGTIIVEEPMAGFAVQYGAIEYGRGKPRVVISPLAEVDEADVTASLSRGRPLVLVPASTRTEPTSPPVGRWERIGDLYRLAPSP